ncbi:MAG: glycosyltransferase family 2 protein [Acidobacteriota bacterium]|nr:glycosyltransferase family 2 protein [Acidobacteriota bacterium]
MLTNEDVLVVVPAFNEAMSVAGVVREVAQAAPRAHILVVDDGSTDATAAAARDAGAEVVTNIFNLGVGGAMRVGFRYAAARHFRVVVQVDGDGQHDPRDLARLIDALEDKPHPEVVIGARFAGEGDYEVPVMRRWAMRLLARYLSGVAHVKLTDVTSGFRAHNRAAIELFARTYPADYLADTVESLVIAVENGGVISQVPVSMRSRTGGTPSQNTGRAAMYLARVSLMLLIALFRHRAPRSTTEAA